MAVIRGNVNNIQSTEGKWPALMGSNADCDISGDFPMTPLIRGCPRNVDPTSTFSDLVKENVTLFPNPSTIGLVNITSPYPIESYAICDSSGRIVRTGLALPAHEIDINGLEQGLYFISLSIQGQRVTKKFLKSS